MTISALAKLQRMTKWLPPHLQVIEKEKGFGLVREQQHQRLADLLFFNYKSREARRIKSETEGISFITKTYRISKEKEGF
ncbi:MAG: hypothetical protein J6T78_07150 [Bacteroidaceae bacterium]|nr:hypothetical protein [Bacteroidaceae bacterium]